jgi:AraC-like DNA-binding protein/predicted transcriptional regulator YdeE
LISNAAIGEDVPVGNNSEVVRSVMDWARGRLGEELGLASLSARAGYSAHHFSRLFAASVGLSPAEWIERERIAAAERLLAGSRLRILDIALECGFKDAATFSRAFSRVAGLSPSAYRSGLRLALEPAVAAAPPEGGLVSSTRVEALAGLRLVGLLAEVRGEEDAGLPGLLWSRLPREAAAAGLLPERPEYYQLAFWEESAEEAFSCLAGFGSLSPSPPLPFVSSSLPPCLCLVCGIRGPMERIGDAYAEIYGSILPAMTERPALNFVLERYPPDGEPEICLPLRLAR